MAVEIRWADVDAYGHVSHIALIAIAEHARSRWIDGVLEVAPATWPYVVVHLAFDFRASARFVDRTVQGIFSPTEIGNSSVRLKETLTTSDGRVIAEGGSVIVAWDEASSATRPLSDEERKRFAGPHK